MSTLRKRVIGFTLMFAMILAPTLVLALAGYSAAAGAAMLPAAAGVIATLLGGPRLALMLALPFSLAMGLASLTAHNPLLAGVVMAASAFAAGMLAKVGRHTNAYGALIAIGFTIAAPPHLSDDAVSSALVLAGISLACVLYAVAVGALLHQHLPKFPSHPEPMMRAAIYAVTMAILTGVAAAICVHWKTGHPGGWFIMTVVLVLQPYIQDAWRRTWQRAAGTVVGVIAAMLIFLIIPWDWALYTLAGIFMVAAFSVITDPKAPYWLFTSFLTPGIVLMEGVSTSIINTGLYRLGATFAGVGLALLAEAILLPVYRRGAKVYGLDHY